MVEAKVLCRAILPQRAKNGNVLGGKRVHITFLHGGSASKDGIEREDKYF